MKRGAEFPAGAGHMERDRLVLDDGYHRLQAGIRAGKRRMAWYVIEGNPAAITRFAYAVNTLQATTEARPGTVVAAALPTAPAPSMAPPWTSAPATAVASTPQKTPSESSEDGVPEPAGALVQSTQDRVLAGLVEAVLAPHSPATRSAYRYDLRAWLRYCRDMNLHPLTAGRTDVERYLAGMRTAGLAPATIARRLSTLTALFDRAVDDAVLLRSPMLRVRRPPVPRTGPRQGLTRQEARSLLQAAASKDSRTQLLVAVLLLTGVRISELCNASVEDLRRHGEHLLLRVTRKGRHQDCVVLPAYVREVLHEHLQGRTSGALLQSKRGRRLDRTTAGRLVKTLASTALPHRPDVSPHVLRHTFCSLALRAGVELWDLSRAAGHRDIRTTTRYLTELQDLDRHPSGPLVHYLLPEGHTRTNGDHACSSLDSVC